MQPNYSKRFNRPDVVVNHHTRCTHVTTVWGLPAVFVCFPHSWCLTSSKIVTSVIHPGTIYKEGECYTSQ